MSRDLLKRALSAIMSVRGFPSGMAIDTIRAIEAELNKPEPEPVAWMVENHPEELDTFVNFTPNFNSHFEKLCCKVTPLYTTTPDQSARVAEMESKYMQPSGLQAKQEPLTERQIEIACSKINPEDYFEGVEFGIENHGLSNVFRYEEAITRAIENAHGILEE